LGCVVWISDVGLIPITVYIREKEWVIYPVALLARDVRRRDFSG
jgi:hypothetical protein